MLDIKNLCVDYDGKRALEGFNLHMEAGQIVALVGESGSGKTTAIRTVLGLLPPGGEVAEGTIDFEGTDLVNLYDDEWVHLRGERLSMIFQDAGAMLNPIRTIGGQFVEYIRAHRQMDKAEARKLAGEMLGKMGLPDTDSILRSYPFQLSGGQRQRVGIAMAMTFQPKLLLADEPTSALDVTTQAQIVRQMMELRDGFGTAILIVTHNLGVAAYMADHIVVMKNGHIVDEGSRDDLLASDVAYTKQLLAAVPDLREVNHV